MDKKEILEEAKATIENINKAQDTLDKYISRLDNIVSKLEYESFKKEKLTMSDVVNIQEKLKESEVEVKQSLKAATEEIDLIDNKEEVVEKAVKTESEQKPKKVKITEIKAAKTKTKKQKTHGFLVNILIFFGIISLALSMFLTVKKIKPDFKILNHYIYGYQDTNMEDDIAYNSLVFIEKLKMQEILVGDDISFKENKQQIKIVRVVDNTDEIYKTKSISHIFEDDQTLIRSEILGKVKYVIPVLGGIFVTLVDSLWLLYLISGLILLIAFLLNNRYNN